MIYKIISIFLLTIILFAFIFSSHVFAISDVERLDISYNDTPAFVTINLTDAQKSYNYIYSFFNLDFSEQCFGFEIFITNDELVISQTINHQPYIAFKDGQAHQYYVMRGSSSCSAFFNSDHTYTFNGSDFFSLNRAFNPDAINFILNDNHYKFYSNVNLTNSLNEVVFQVAPQEEEQTQTTNPIMVQLISSMDFSMILMEILHLLPIVLIMLVGLMSLRKAINLLLMVVHRA